MRIATAVLLEGAWYAIEQCGFLLRDAVTLHEAKAYSSAVALALLAREELGRYKILLGFWRKAQEKGEGPTVKDVRKACDDHVEKQRKALLSVQYKADHGTRLGGLLEAQIGHRPDTEAYKEASRDLEELNKRKIKRTPEERHSLRMRSLYVGINDAGNSWNRPCEMPPEEAYNCLEHAINDYSVQRDKVQPEGLPALHPQLASALEEWPSRPTLPTPTWPKPF